jgi:hypothetical protein
MKIPVLTATASHISAGFSETISARSRWMIQKMKTMLTIDQR